MSVPFYFASDNIETDGLDFLMRCGRIKNPVAPEQLHK